MYESTERLIRESERLAMIRKYLAEETYPSRDILLLLAADDMPSTTNTKEENNYEEV